MSKSYITTCFGGVLSNFITNQPIIQQIKSLVDNILATQKSKPQADTKKVESVTDILVYILYHLTEEEIKIIEGKN